MKEIPKHLMKTTIPCKDESLNTSVKLSEYIEPTVKPTQFNAYEIGQVKKSKRLEKILKSLR